MTTASNPAARTCGEQDCDRTTSQPGHPLCRAHYQELQQGDINTCPNHPKLYKPAKFPLCRVCNSPKKAQPARQHRPQAGNNLNDPSKGWNQTPDNPLPKEAVEAVQTVRRNLTEHEKACTNHESNTIQFLIMPMLKGLGWDEQDPGQVIREYRPAGKKRYGNSMAVDIALFENEKPRAFIEAKRLDREYDPQYQTQTGKYAAFLDDGDTAALTNGRYWLVYNIADGRMQHHETIDLKDETPEAVAKRMMTVFGKSTAPTAAAKPQQTPAPERRPQPNPAPQARNTQDMHQQVKGAIAADLKEYRRRTSGQTRQPPYTILKDDTIDALADIQPQSWESLNRVKGIGQTTMSAHGQAILNIISAAREKAGKA